MNKMQARTLRGFRDFLPSQAKKRQWLIGKLRSVFESYGFEPLETPAIERAEILKGKYGEEEKLIYEFETKGKDKVALRYDQTVPLSRVINQYQNDLTFPFKRYQIQNVWRGENPQQGRYREFLQCDGDIVGSNSPISDAEILKLVLDIYKGIGLNVTIRINDRENFKNIEKKYISAIDKLEKIGESQVLSEMINKGMNDADARKALSELQGRPQTITIKTILENLRQLGGEVDKVIYEPTLARGLDYYTGMIFETIVDGNVGSLCSGGRYDKLIGQFSGKDFPAVGFGLGFDRTFEVLEKNNLISTPPSFVKVFVSIFNKALKNKSLEIYKKLRDENINAEIYLDETAPLEKQLKYADKKKIPYSIILGPKEKEENKIVIRNMETGDQNTINIDEVTNASFG